MALVRRRAVTAPRHVATPAKADTVIVDGIASCGNDASGREEEVRDGA